MGELVLNQFFRGDPRIWRDRRRNKDLSIRRLAARSDCPLSRSALNDAIGIHVAVKESPCVLTFSHVSANHVAAVLKLPIAEREELLRLADKERWSVRKLRGSVRSRQTRGQESTRGTSSGQESTPPSSRRASSPRNRTLHALNTIALALSSLAASVRELGEASPLDGELRPNVEKVAKELLDVRSDLLKLRFSRA